MDTEPNRSPVHIPERGIPRNETTKAAWAELDIATAAVEKRPGDPAVQQLFQQARQNFEASFGQIDIGA
ncbi:MAG: hypothetical protein Q7S29_00280 [Candidatus Peribacter sp.]|nr:hypothetical protein [Candidatus Peribacter sp.]